MTEVSYAVAFGSGLLSFFTPCIIPLLPMYFGYLAGEAVDGKMDSKLRIRLITNAAFFVLGLTLLNILLGFGAKAATQLLIQYASSLRIFGGFLLVAFGAYFISGKRLGFMEREHKIHYKKYTPGIFKSFILGVTFSFGWTPCNGPIIASILFMASFTKNYMQAGSLMVVYSVGFGIMFLLSALLMSTFLKNLKGIYPHFRKIKIGAGILMGVMGLLMIFDKISWLNV